MDAYQRETKGWCLSHMKIEQELPQSLASRGQQQIHSYRFTRHASHPMAEVYAAATASPDRQGTKVASFLDMRFNVGDLVVVSSAGKLAVATGTVLELKPDSMTIAFERKVKQVGGPFFVILATARARALG